MMTVIRSEWGERKERPSATSTFLSFLLLSAELSGGDIGVPDKEQRRKDKVKTRLLFMNLLIYLPESCSCSHSTPFTSALFITLCLSPHHTLTPTEGYLLCIPSSLHIENTQAC